MKRLLAVVALALLGIAPAHAQAARIVAHGSLRNFTSTTPVTETIFTPKVTGQYRLSVYASIAQRDALGQSIYTVTSAWYDPGPGPEQSSSPVAGNAARPYAYAPLFVGSFVTAKQTPVTITVSKSTTDLSIASVYWVLELLEPVETE